MGKNTTIVFSATVIFLALILSCPAAAQTMSLPQTTTTQPKTTTTSPTLTQQPPTVLRPQVGSALISVRDDYGHPVSAAAIILTGNGQSLTQLTSVQGEASFGNLGVGQYSYTVRKDGYYSPFGNLYLNISMGMTTPSIYVLNKSGSAKVQVTENGIAVAEAQVCTMVSGKVQCITTDAGGFAYFSNLPPGAYTFEASKFGFITQVTSAKVASGQSLSIPVALIPSSNPIYDKNCASCHGLDGRGSPAKATMLKVDPNTLNLGRNEVANQTRDEKKQIIIQGKGKMPAFQKKLGSNEIDAVTSYILRLIAVIRGTAR